MELVYANVVFDEEMVFERGERTIEMRWLGQGNTSGDPDRVFARQSCDFEPRLESAWTSLGYSEPEVQ